MKHWLGSLMVMAWVSLCAVPTMAAVTPDEIDDAPGFAGNEVNIPATDDPNSPDFLPEGAPMAPPKTLPVKPPKMPVPVKMAPEKIIQPMPVAAPQAPLVKLPAVKEQSIKMPEPKVPQLLEIPLIETHNAVTSHAGVTFVTGGIGDDERSAIEAAKSDYNLHVMSASSSGAFIGDARVVITRKTGATAEVMLSVVAGPLLYVRLPAGTYTLDATLGAQTKHQVVTVNKNAVPARVSLGWKVTDASDR